METHNKIILIARDNEYIHIARLFGRLKYELVVNDNEYCIDDATDLTLSVFIDNGVTIEFTILPPPDNSDILAGPLECDNYGSKSHGFFQIFLVLK